MYRLAKPLLVTAAAVILLAAGYAAYRHHRYSHATEPSIDLLAGQWSYLPGATQHSGELHISATGFTVVKQDGSGGQPNPPVNEYGTRLRTSGDFSVTSQFSHQTADASLQLYDSAPIIADEFRIEPASIRLTETGNQLTVQVMNGSDKGDVHQPQPIYRHTFKLPAADKGALTVTKRGNQLSVSAGNHKVVDLPQDGRLFNFGSVLLGLDSSSGSFDVTSLTAQGLDGDELSTVDTSLATPLKPAAGGLASLADEARPGFQIGAAVALAPYTSDTAYARETAGNFNIVTLENAMKPQFISPKQGVFNFQEADALIAIAKKNHQLVHGHCIAFSEAEPAWMRNLPSSTPAERAASGKILLNYASTVAGHFKNDLYSLDGVNEPFDTDDGTTLQQNIWFQTLGPDYAAQVFRVVHQAAPNIKLFLNENGAEQAGARQDAVIQYAVGLKNQGVPIYGVGLQSHVYDKDDDIIYNEDLEKAISELGQHGLKVRISEMDVPADASYSKDDPEAGAGAQYQSWQYNQVFQQCFKMSNCIGFTTWGVNNRYDVYQADNGSLAYGQDLLFLANNRPTLAYTDIQKFLRAQR